MDKKNEVNILDNAGSKKAEEDQNIRLVFDKIIG